MKKLAFIILVSSMVIWSCGSKHHHPGANADDCKSGTCDVASHQHPGASAEDCKSGTCDVASHHHDNKAKGASLSGQEHGGQEHGGQEHGGQEHGGEAVQEFSAADIKGAMNVYITGREEEGVFKIHDEKTGEDLNLKFIKIHDPVRKIEGKGFFACTDFEVVGETDKLYDLDFWLNPEDGTLKVYDEKIHKHPVAIEGGWEKKARYTFVNDNPVEIE
ncbi:hypothetical protein HQ531_15625 [bacterium]|nr:hypothetical protein [bacterium]